MSTIPPISVISNPGPEGPEGPPGAPGADGIGVPDPALEDDGRMLEVDSGALVYRDPPPANVVVSDDIVSIVKLTQAEYNALTPPDDDVLYVVVG
jgi:hypothetical protein